MASSVIKEHAADEAGGEVILSSDGMDPLPSVRPPAIVTSLLSSSSSSAANAMNKNGYGDLDTASGIVSMEEALEAFAAPGSSAHHLLRSKRETPRERLERLSRELTEVETDVRQDDVLRKQVTALQLRLQGQQQIMQKSVDAAGQSPAVAAAASTATTTTLQPEVAAALQADLTVRLMRLEKAVGEPATMNNNGKALLERLSQLEAAMEVMDDHKLEAAARKAKVLRQDLEAASKARNKLMAPNRAEDSKTLTALYDSMMELQEMSQHLPALAQRLQTLSIQHVDASTWASRLQAAEAAVTRLNAQISSVETAVSHVEGSWHENADMLRNNLKALDDRFHKLAG